MHSLTEDVLKFKPLVRSDILQSDRTYLEEIKTTFSGFRVEPFSCKRL